jgi:hypothetical protein
MRWLWCARPASNRHGIAYEAMALPIELQARDWSERQDLNLRPPVPNEMRYQTALRSVEGWRPAGGSNPSKIRRQRIRFTSCVAGLLCGSGALGRSRTDMVARHPLKMVRLPISPRALELEDQVGLEPT